MRKPGKLFSAAVIAIAASGRYRFVPGGIDPNADTLLLEGEDWTLVEDIPAFDTSRKIACVPSAGCTPDVIGAVAS